MATTVGKESDINGLVKDLLKLEHDAVAAYETAIERLDDAAAKTELESFRQDHLSHVAELEKMAGMLGLEPVTSGDAKEMLTTGKIKMANLMGDKAVLKAMSSNETDTVAAYDRASTHDDAVPESKAFFAKALADERRHKAWMDRTADAM
jgi:rubrerythrin